MTKKSIVIVSSIIISVLIGLNIYMYTKSYSVSQYIYQNNVNAKGIVLIDKFRVNINRMSQAQKLYLVTSKEEYKKEYENILENVYSSIEELEKSNSIDDIEKEELIMVLDEYSDMEKTMSNLIKGEVISENLEKAVIESNQAQLNILKQLDKSVDKTKENLVKQNDSFVSQINTQKNTVQILSTIITAIGSSFIYYIKKNPAKFGTKVGKIISSIDDEEKDTGICIGNNIKKIEAEIIEIEKEAKQSKKCMLELLNHEKNLEGIRLINNEANNLKAKLLEGDEILAKIDFLLKKLIIDIEEIKECSEQIQAEKIRNIEEVMVDLRILFETLPIYSSIILDISTNIKNNNSVEKL